MTDKEQGLTARWRDRPLGGATLEDRAAALMQKALVPGEPDDTTLERIAKRIRGGRQRPLYARLAFRMVFASLFLIAGGASVKAYEMIRKAAWLQRTQTPASLPPPPRAASHQRALRGNPPSTSASASDRPTLSDPLAVIPAPVAPSDPDPLPVAPPADREPREKARATRRELSPTLSRPVAAEGSTLLASREPLFSPSAVLPPKHNPAPTPSSTSSTDEVAALDRAMTLLRRDRNAEAALAAFDAYLARHPDGILNREARFGRVDALLMLHRSDDALPALESLPLDSHRRSTELQVIRGELRSRSNCASAIADFSQALGHSPDAGLLERILYGRGACRAKTGDSLGAALDLQRYLERFPQAPHATWARRWLAGHEKQTTDR